MKRLSSIEIKYWEEKAIAHIIKGYEEYMDQFADAIPDDEAWAEALEIGKKLKEIRDAKEERKQ